MAKLNGYIWYHDAIRHSWFEIFGGSGEVDGVRRCDYLNTPPLSFHHFTAWNTHSCNKGYEMLGKTEFHAGANVCNTIYVFLTGACQHVPLLKTSKILMHVHASTVRTLTIDR